MENFIDFSRPLPASRSTADRATRNTSSVGNGVEAQVGDDNIPITGIGGSATSFGGTQADPDLFDVERIEVLRGPQGTLYGANSMSGVVRVIANKPNTDEFEAAFDGGFSSIEEGASTYSAKGMVNVPIIDDRLAIRLVGYYRDVGGFIDAIDIPVDYQKRDFFGPGMDAPAADDATWVANDVNDAEITGGRFSLGALLGERTSLTAQVYYQDMETGGKPHHRPDDSSNVITNVFFPGAGDLKQIYYAQNVFDDKTVMTNLTLEHDFDWSILTMSASSFDRDVFSQGDTSVSFKNLIPAPVVPFSGFLTAPQNADMDSYEVRLATQLDGPVNALVGAFHQDRSIEFENWLFLLTGPNMPDTSTRRFNRVTMDDTGITALFGEIYYEPNDLWEFTAGLRYFETKRDVFSQLLIGFFRFPGNPDPPELFNTDEDDVIFKLRAARRFSDDILGYVELGEGFRAGGTNSAQVSGIPGVYGPDSTRNLEIGVKTDLLDQKLRVNASIYHIQWHDMQALQCFGFDGNPDPSCPFDAIVNVDGETAGATGLEVDILATPTERWTFTSAISINDTGLARDLGVGFDPLAVEGTEMVGARKFTFAASGAI